MRKSYKPRLLAIALLAKYAVGNAQVILPSSSTTLELQELYPNATSFLVQEGTVITTTSNDGVRANAAKDWRLENRGSITGANDGVSIGVPETSLLNIRVENYGSINSTATSGVGPVAVFMASGGTVVNHENATITGVGAAVGIQLGQAGVVINDGLVQGGTSNDGVRIARGGVFTQGATGRVEGMNGLRIPRATVQATNAGTILGGNAGVWASGASVTLDNTGGTIGTLAAGPQASAVMADAAATINLTGGTVTGVGLAALGLNALGAQSVINASNLSVRTTGERTHGVSAESGGRVNVNNVAVTVEGSPGSGVMAWSGGTIEATGGSVTTTGDAARGMTANGAEGTDNDGGTITASGVAVNTAGAKAFGVSAEGNGLGVPANISLTDGSVETSGESAFGLLSLAQTTLTATNVAVTTHGASADGATARSGASLAVKGGTVTTTGDNAAGLSTTGAGEPDLLAGIRDPRVSAAPGASLGGASLAATGVTVNTSGTAAHAVRVRGDSGMTLTDTTATASGPSANAVQYELLASEGQPRTGTFLASGSTLVSQQGSGVAVSGGTLNATLTATSLTGSAALLNVTGGSTLNLTAEAGSTLTGVALTEAGSASNLVLRDSTWHVTGDSRLTSLNNDPSQVLFAAPAGGVYKTLTVNQYTGDGTIGVNTYLGGDGSPSDRLVIDGGTASGTSKVRVTNAGGPGLVTTANGIQVIDTINGGTTQAGAFTLDGRAVAGPYEYRLFRGGADGTAPEGWFLRSEQSPTPPDPTPPDPAPPEPSPPAPTPPTPVRPLYRPEVAAYLANQRLSGQMFVHSLHDRRGEPQGAEGAGVGRPGAGWLRMVGKWEGGRSQDGVFKTSTDAFLLQGGAELATWPAGGTAGRLHAGVMGSYGNASSDARAEANNARAKGKVEGWALGIYGTWYQNDEIKHGAYADAWFQYGWFSNRVEGDYLPTVKYHASGLAVSGETGYAVPLPGGWVVEPQAQVIYVDYSEDDILEPNGTRVSRAGASGLLTRLGVRTHRTFERADGRKVQPYATVNWWYADTDSNISFNQVPIGTMYPRNRFEVKVGANLALNRAWSGWANVSGAWGQQDYYQYAVRAGVRYAW